MYAYKFGLIPFHEIVIIADVQRERAIDMMTSLFTIVTALYEIIPQGVLVTEMASIDELKYQHAKTVRRMAFADEWMTIKFRYKEPDGETSKMVQHIVAGSKTPFGLTSENFRWSAAVASFGILLRESEYAGDANLEKVSQWAGAATDSDVQGYKKEFLDMINTAKQYEPVAKK